MRWARATCFADAVGDSLHELTRNAPAPSARCRGLARGVVVPLGIDRRSVSRRRQGAAADRGALRAGVSRLDAKKGIDLLIDAFHALAADAASRRGRWSLPATATVVCLAPRAAGRRRPRARSHRFRGWVRRRRSSAARQRRAAVRAAVASGELRHRGGRGDGRRRAGHRLAGREPCRATSTRTAPDGSWRVTSQAWTDALRCAMADPDEIDRRGRRARILAEHFRWPAVGRQLIAMYERGRAASGRTSPSSPRPQSAPRRPAAAGRSAKRCAALPERCSGTRPIARRAGRDRRTDDRRTRVIADPTVTVSRAARRPAPRRGPARHLRPHAPAIIDLSTARAQPMAHARRPRLADVQRRDLQLRASCARSSRRAGRRFRPQSDTEVILHGYDEWGDGRRRAAARHVRVRALGRARRERLAAGARPARHQAALRLSSDDRRLLFASEVRALLATGPGAAAARPDGAGPVLAYQTVPAPRTLVDGVRDARARARG